MLDVAFSHGRRLHQRVSAGDDHLGVPSDEPLHFVVVYMATKLPLALKTSASGLTMIVKARRWLCSVNANACAAPSRNVEMLHN